MRWKWIPIILVSIVIVVIVAVYIILSGYDYNKLKPHIERAAYEATGREVKFGGDIELEIGFTPSLVVENVSFENAKWGSRAEAMSIRRFELQVAILPLLGGNIDIKRLVLVEPDILIETDRSGKSNLEFKPPEKTAPEIEEKKEPSDDELSLPALVLGELLLENGRLTYIDGKSEKSTSIKLERLSAVAAGMKSAVSINLKGSLDDMPFGVSGRLDSLAKLTGPPRGALKVSALKIRLAQSDITGSIDVNLSAPRPLITASLASDNIDLRELLKKGEVVEEEEEAVKKPAKEEKVFSSEPLPIDSLRSADLELRFKAGSLLLPALALKDLSIEMSIVNGHLKLSPFKAKVGGGTLDVNVEIRPKGSAVALNASGKVDGLDLATIGKELDITEALDGSIDAEIRLKGRGASVAALMAGLNGEKKVVMGSGRIENSLLKSLGGDLRSNTLRLLNPLAGHEDVTIINCIVADFSIDDGLVSSSALVLDTGYMSVVGDGKINLKTEKLNISLKPVPKEGLKAGGIGKLSQSLGELSTPFKLGGTLANPKLALDPAQAALTAGKMIGGGKSFFERGGSIAEALEGGSKGDENPCLRAIESSKKSADTKTEKKKEGILDKAIGGGPKEIKDLGEGLQKLFGK